MNIQRADHSLQIWKGLASRHKPQGPPFSCVAAYQYWCSLNMKEWRLDEDPLTSAKLLLNNAGASSDEGTSRVQMIDIENNVDYDCLAFSLPEILKEWGNPINEVVMDSACKLLIWHINTKLTRTRSYPGKCTTGNWELFVLLGEARGSGLALGWCFVRSKGRNPETGSKEAILTAWLTHFRDKWNIKAKVTHSDKDHSEINAFACVFPEAKHQLCYWHVLRAIKKRLSILHCQPVHYDSKGAVKSFPFISPNFLPITQRYKLPETLVR